MVAFWACLVLAPSLRFMAALRLAEDQYELAEPCPIESPRLCLEDAADQFRDIESRFGPDPRAVSGLARCLLHQGRYADAAVEFERAGRLREAAEARRRASIALRLARQARGWRVLQIEPVPGRRRWVALLGKPRDSDDRPSGFPSDGSELRLLDCTHGDLHETARFALQTDGTAAEENPQNASLYWLRVDGAHPRWVLLVYRNFLAADCDPSDETFLFVGSDRFKKGPAFRSLDGASVLGSSKGQPIVVSVAPTFKVWWPDTYEWDGRRVVFANRRHRKLYRPWVFSKGDCDHVYPHWMVRAAALDVQGRFREAAEAWKVAEGICRSKLLSDRRGNPWPYGYTGFFGDDYENLKEIRKRLRWLRRRDYNHWLLYRPYDFDLQVPPFRLGHAEITDR
jgi:hypothetical protein